MEEGFLNDDTGIVSEEENDLQASLWPLSAVKDASRYESVIPKAKNTMERLISYTDSCSYGII